MYSVSDLLAHEIFLGTVDDPCIVNFNLFIDDFIIFVHARVSTGVKYMLRG